MWIRTTHQLVWIEVEQSKQGYGYQRLNNFILFMRS